MKIQTAKICINPDQPVRAAGYAQQVQPLDTVRDPLFARVLVLEQQGERYVHCALDSLQAPRQLLDSLKAVLEKGWAMPVHLVISGTHTHFAPDMRDEGYRNQVLKQLTALLLPITLREAELTCSFVREPFQGVGRSRISHWATDEIYAQALCLYDRGQRIASLLIHNCHPTSLDGNTPFFTSEYPGYALRQLEQEYPGEYFAFLQGAAGDVSTRFTRKEQTTEQMEAFGERMAQEFDSLLKQTPETASCILDYAEVKLPLKHELKDPAALKIPEYYSVRERETLEYGIQRSQENLAHPENLRTETQFSVLRFGPFRLIFSEFELFSEYNTAVDPKHSALICYSQGYSHYVAGPSFDGMTYETLQDTLDATTRQSFLDCIRTLSR